MNSRGFSTYAVVMAGGKGRRLWPLSTPNCPKQFIPFGGKSLLTRTVERVEPLIPAERILVIAGSDQRDMVEEQVPQVPKRNIFEEPQGKNTSPCIGMAALLSQNRLGLDPAQSVMVVLPSDHLVTDQPAFEEVLNVALEVAWNKEMLVTLGITPTSPATGYGYIEAGETLGIESSRRVIRFREKPDRETAQNFLQQGDFFWNSGSFIWRTDVFLTEIGEKIPQLISPLGRIERSLNTEQENEIIEREYIKMPSVSIDRGLMEKASNCAVVPASIGWSDVGNWENVARLLRERESQNAVHGEAELFETSRTIVYNQLDEKPIVVLGVDNLVVVEAEESVLVMNKDKSQELKRVVDKLKQGGVIDSAE